MRVLVAAEFQQLYERTSSIAQIQRSFLFCDDDTLCIDHFLGLLHSSLLSFVSHPRRWWVPDTWVCPTLPTLLPCGCLIPTLDIRTYLPFSVSFCGVIVPLCRTYEAHLSSLFLASHRPDTWSWRRRGFVEVEGSDLTPPLRSPGSIRDNGIRIGCVNCLSFKTNRSTSL